MNKRKIIQYSLLAASLLFMLIALIFYVYAVVGPDKNLLFVGFDRLNKELAHNYTTVIGSSSVIILLGNYVITFAVIGIIAYNIYKYIKDKNKDTLTFVLYTVMAIFVGYFLLIFDAMFGYKIREVIQKVSNKEWKVTFNAIVLPLAYFFNIISVALFLISYVAGVMPETVSNKPRYMMVIDDEPIQLQETDPNAEAHVLCCQKVICDTGDSAASLNKMQIINPGYVYTKNDTDVISEEEKVTTEYDDIFNKTFRLHGHIDSVEETPFEEAKPEKEVVAEPLIEEANEEKEESQKKIKVSPKVKEITKSIKEKVTKSVKAKKVPDESKDYYVSFRKDLNRWEVKLENAEKAVKVFDTQKEAADFASELASKNNKGVKIVTLKGHITDYKVNKK